MEMCLKGRATATDRNKQERSAGLSGHNSGCAEDKSLTVLSEFTTSGLKDKYDFQTIHLSSITGPVPGSLSVCGLGAGSGLSKQLLTLRPPHLHHGCYFLPLLWTRVHTRGVVSAGMKEENTLLWDFLRRNSRDFCCAAFKGNSRHTTGHC